VRELFVVVTDRKGKSARGAVQTVVAEALTATKVARVRRAVTIHYLLFSTHRLDLVLQGCQITFTHSPSALVSELDSRGYEADDTDRDIHIFPLQRRRKSPSNAVAFHRSSISLRNNLF
jgi:hypothetical protein